MSSLAFVHPPSGAENVTQPAPDTAQAVDFAKRFFENGVAILTAILEGGAPDTMTFDLSNQAGEVKIAAWIDQWQGKRNIYFMVNSCKKDLFKHEKAKKELVKEARWLHADIDQRVGEELETEKKRALRLLSESKQPPTIIVDSGGGIQAFWKLNQPYVVQGEPTKIEFVESRNRKLMFDYSADHCWNIDRIMRLPGTINLPSEKKKKKGRIPVTAVLLEFHEERIYSINQFESLSGTVSISAKLSVESKTAIANSRSDSLTLEALSTKLDSKVIDAIRDKYDAKRWPSRSESVCYIVSAMIRADLIDEEIVTVLVNPAFGISESILEKRNPKAEALRQARRIRERVNAETAAGPAFSEEAIALTFAAAHADNLRYVKAWGAWMIFDGVRWSSDQTHRVRDLVRRTCRDTAAKVKPENQSFRCRIASAKTVAAVEKLAQADRRLAASSDQWDVDPWLLNTPDGTVNLRTGELRAHRPEDFLTKCTAVAPAASGTPCDKWHDFLKTATGGDRSLENYLQRLFGYCLTGLTTEHVFAFAYGTGANGKTVTVNTISGILGDYATSTPIETFTASPTDRHPTELADLRGARLVTASETEEGRFWAESRIKQLTGGDPVKARLMRQDFFQYHPQFKILIQGNHRPRLKTVDEAMRRRLHLIPFAVTIPKTKRDDKLVGKLREEWSAIMRWLIDGCLQWQRERLNPPNAVLAATEQYFAAEDAVAQWAEDRCEVNPNGWESYAVLHESFRMWAEPRGEYVLPQRRFIDHLEKLGCRPHRKSDARGLLGLRLKESPNIGEDGVLL